VIGRKGRERVCVCVRARVLSKSAPAVNLRVNTCNVPVVCQKLHMKRSESNFSLPTMT
jgi:hypothetical protein